MPHKIKLNIIYFFFSFSFMLIGEIILIILGALPPWSWIIVIFTVLTFVLCVVTCKGLIDKLRKSESSRMAVTRDITLTRLLNGDTINDSLLNFNFENHGLAFKDNGFCVIVFVIDDFDQSVLEDGAEASDFTDATYHYVKEITETRFMDEGVCAYVTVLDWNIVCILNFDATQIDRIREQQSLENIIQHIILHLETEHSIISTASVSNPCEGRSGVPLAYEEARRVVEYRKMLGLHESVLFFHQMSRDSFNKLDESSYNRGFAMPDGSFALEKEKLFITYMFGRDYKAAKSVISDMLNAEFNNQTPTIEVIRYRFYGIINTMINAVDYFRTDVEEEFFSSIFPEIDLTQIRTPLELQEKLNYIFDKLIEYDDNKRSRQPPDWIIKIKEYTMSDFRDPDLNITKVAGQFNLNPAYASRIFKSFEDVGILDYIHLLRIEEAKKLLSEGATVKDTAETVGFSNTRAMTRAFVKHLGLTPGKFSKFES